MVVLTVVYNIILKQGQSDVSKKNYRGKAGLQSTLNILFQSLQKAISK